jgi:hypothetical protein
MFEFSDYFEVVNTLTSSLGWRNCKQVYCLNVVLIGNVENQTNSSTQMMLEVWCLALSST